MRYTLEIHKSGYRVDDPLAKTVIEIDDNELEYVMQQLKFNQPVILVMNETIFCFSPMQCVSITISPIEEK